MNHIVEQWKEALPKDSPLYQELLSLTEKELHEHFYNSLTFGTGGLRGVMGVGTNHMNLYTVGGITRAMAQHLKNKSTSPKVAISFDSRHSSDYFAEITARIFGEEGIEVYLFDQCMPTPVLSFAVRHYGCTGGVMITASHNPKEYNGYKAYDHEGCQLGDEDCQQIMTFSEKIPLLSTAPILSLAELQKQGLVTMIGQQLMELYVEKVLEQSTLPHDQCDHLKVVYSPLHGAGLVPVQRLFHKMGKKNVGYVLAQLSPDGDFPTCPYPNPETTEAMALGMEELRKGNGDLFLATDPDADRVGVAILDKGKPRLLTGNEVGVLLLDYLLQRRMLEKKEVLGKVVVSTIVSTPMAEVIAKSYGCAYRNVLTGFRNIGRIITKLTEEGREQDFLFGFEDSCGYLTGSYVRDKDGVLAVLLVTEMAEFYQSCQLTLGDRLEQLAKIHGRYLVHTHSVVFAGSDGMAKMRQIMMDTLANPLTEIGGSKVVGVWDYVHGRVYEKDCWTPKDLPTAQVAVYDLENGNRITLRPSGTEPKLKLYLALKGEKQEVLEIEKEELIAELIEKLM